MKTKSSVEVWNVLYGKIFARFGVPVELRCDRGNEFRGVLTQQCEQYGVRIVRTSV